VHLSRSRAKVHGGQVALCWRVKQWFAHDIVVIFIQQESLEKRGEGIDQKGSRRVKFIVPGHLIVKKKKKESDI
jgi:hypothetical protein